MRSEGCSLCGGSVEKFHGAKHQRVQKKSFIDKNYGYIAVAAVFIVFLLCRKKN